jgi:hypothetical protein
MAIIGGPGCFDARRGVDVIAVLTCAISLN